MTQLVVSHRGDAMRIANSLTNAGIAYSYTPFTFTIQAGPEVLRHTFRLMPDIASRLATQRGHA